MIQMQELAYLSGQSNDQALNHTVHNSRDVALTKGSSTSTVISIQAVAVLRWGQGAQAPQILPSPPQKKKIFFLQATG